MPELVLAKHQLAFGFLHIGDPLRDGVTKGLDRNPLAQTFSFQQPVAALAAAADAHRPALPLDPSQAVLQQSLWIISHAPWVSPDASKTAGFKLNLLSLLSVHSIGTIGRASPVEHFCVHIPAGSDSRSKPQN